jgi:hypothetical protein
LNPSIIIIINYRIIIINVYYKYIINAQYIYCVSNKGCLEEQYKIENVAITGAATVSCLERICKTFCLMPRILSVTARQTP